MRSSPTAKATSQLLIRKKAIESPKTGRSSCSRGTVTPGWIGSIQARNFAARDIASAPAVALNRGRSGEGVGLRNQLVRINESRATTKVATSDPNQSTAVKTNASETEIRAFTEGTLILKVPVSTVSPAKRSQSYPNEL